MAVTQWEKTRMSTIFVVIIALVVVFLVQRNADASLARINCSYFDPIAVDVLALAFAFFLIIEGVYRMHEHKHSSIKNQITRIVRVAFGASIFSLHIFQALHK